MLATHDSATDLAAPLSRATEPHGLHGEDREHSEPDWLDCHTPYIVGDRSERASGTGLGTIK